MTALEKIFARFGRPYVDVFSPTSYRVWVKSGWHVHNGASTGDPVGQGESLEEAAQALLDYVAKPGSLLVKGECDQRCCNQYNASPASKKAYRELREFIKGAAAEVRSWPAWKRGGG